MAILAVGLLALVAIFFPESQAAVRVWIDSTAYGHCFLVVPIAIYLIWERRGAITGLRPRAAPAALLLGIPLAVMWLAAERLGIMEGRQLAALGFVELLFLVVLGWELYWALLGPLLYLVFLVPFGAFITPALQSFTAQFIDLGLSALGISHYVSDLVIEISAGTFFVAEACAGLRFLIASIAFGVFYALLNYQSMGRRTFFIALSIVVPIVANGLRALGIVLLGHILGSAEAAAADHIIYGWVFFSIVMLLLVVAGMPLREPPAQPRMVRPSTRDAVTGYPWAAAVVLLIAAVGPAIAIGFDRNESAPSFARPFRLAAPDGCELAQDAPSGDQAKATFTCGTRQWALTAQLLPARSTGRVLVEVRSRLTGSLGAEDATVVPLRNAPAAAGRWQVLVAREPESITATAAWIHGAPAPGGLQQRLMQARDSVAGNTIPPMFIAISTKPSQAMSEAALEATLLQLNSILAAQGSLDDLVAQTVSASR